MRRLRTKEAVLTAITFLPKAHTGIAGDKSLPNTYDVNSVKRHDDNSAINTKTQKKTQVELQIGA